MSAIAARNYAMLAFYFQRAAFRLYERAIIFALFSRMPCQMQSPSFLSMSLYHATANVAMTSADMPYISEITDE